MSYEILEEEIELERDRLVNKEEGKAVVLKLHEVFDPLTKEATEAVFVHVRLVGTQPSVVIVKVTTDFDTDFTTS